MGRLPERSLPSDLPPTIRHSSYGDKYRIPDRWKSRPDASQAGVGRGSGAVRGPARGGALPHHPTSLQPSDIHRLARNIVYQIVGYRIVGTLTLVNLVWAEEAVQCGDPPVGASQTSQYTCQ